MLRRVRNCRRY